MIGETVSHYRITKQLGAGGMGVVYEAVDTDLDRTIALKFLPPESTRDPEAKARFVYEAKAASALDHPNVCTIHEIGETADGRLFLAMARYEGETLKERVGRGRLPAAAAIEIVRQVAEGLAKAHAQGIVHRDIKPANIFVTADGLVKILDFGLAKLAGQAQLTRTGTTLGTAHYMSPEQARGGEVDQRSDIFSLGVVLYQLLTGKPPFRGDHEAAVVYGILHATPEPLAAHGADGGPELQAVVDRALAKDPAFRYQTVADVSADLATVAGSGAPSGARAPRTPGRRAWLWTAAAAFAALAVVVGFRFLPGSPPSATTSEAAENLVIAIAPFWGSNPAAREEGRVMQALVERELAGALGQDAAVTVLGKKEVVEAPESLGDVTALGEKLGAMIVVWGEVLILRDEVEIQPYVTRVKWFRGAEDFQLAGMQVNTDAANQLNLRKTKAGDVGQIAILLAAAYFEKTDPDRALALLRGIKPPTAESLFCQGRILLARGEPGEARTVFAKAVELGPDEPRPYWGMGYVCDHQRDYDAAIAWYGRAIAVDSTFESGYAGISVALANQGKHDEAFRWLEDASERFPRAYWICVNLAYAYLGRDQLDEARRWADKAVEVADNPVSLANAYVLLGVLQRRQGEAGESRQWYEKAVATDPHGWRPYMNIGNIHYEQQDYAEAIRWFERGAELNWGGVSNRLPVCHMLLDRYPEAVRVLRRLMEVHPWDVESVLLSTICLHAIGQGDAAGDLIATRAAALSDSAWIAPVLRFYAGEIGAADVLAQAKDEDPATDKERGCQAGYYLGMARLLGRPAGMPPDTAAAVAYLEECVAADLTELPESRLAARQLRELGSVGEAAMKTPE